MPLDELVVQQTILLRQQHRIKLPDAIIAAMALVNSLPLLARSVANFKGIVSSAVRNPHDPTQLPIT